jgi:hypothetical protein
MIQRATLTLGKGCLRVHSTGTGILIYTQATLKREDNHNDIAKLKDCPISGLISTNIAT